MPAPINTTPTATTALLSLPQKCALRSACDLEPIGFIRTLRNDRAAAFRVSFELDAGLFTGFPKLCHSRESGNPWPEI